MNENNKRNVDRNHLMPLKIEAIYQDRHRKYLRGTAKNISINGIYIETPYTREYGEIIHISLVGSYMKKIIGVEGKVIHCEPGKGMGIEFVDQDNNEIKELIRIIKMQDQASLLS
ncbi:MAG: PilZ domain-containing protein [Desulfomonilia bacterium]|nr:PilZ domain-containing protein [Desulfomonilia bacterium]